MMEPMMVHYISITNKETRKTVNRFTRHEVKNGLLAGIELCGSLRSVLEGLHCYHSRRSSSGTGSGSGASDQRRHQQPQHRFRQGHERFAEIFWWRVY
jgi:hypothetical protein